MGRRLRHTPQNQHNQLVLLSTPDANAGPRQRARPRDASAARLLVPACSANVLGSVPTSLPRPDGTSSGRLREDTHRRQGRGNKRGGAGSRREGRPICVQRERRNRTDQEETNLHPPSINVNQRRVATGRGCPDDGTGGWGSGKGGRAGVHSNPRGPLSMGGIRRLGPRQQWHTPRRRSWQRWGVASVVS